MVALLLNKQVFINKPSIKYLLIVRCYSYNHTYIFNVRRYYVVKARSQTVWAHIGLD